MVNSDGQSSSSRATAAASLVDAHTTGHSNTLSTVQSGKLSQFWQISNLCRGGPRSTTSIFSSLCLLPDDFVTGFRKFVLPPEIGPFGDAPEKAQRYAQTAPISRQRPIQDGSNLLVSISIAAPVLGVAPPGPRACRLPPGHLPMLRQRAFQRGGRLVARFLVKERAGVARITDQVTRRPPKYWQCTKLDGRSSAFSRPHGIHGT
jgi:hypothetical protein